ncbi:22392_t:CDS:2, partial [Dentiscutata erythropus]
RRSPNAFILYRRAKQPQIVAQHQGISNDDVSEERRTYPEYRYKPQRPQERKRRMPATARDASTRRVSAPGLPHNLLVDDSAKRQDLGAFPQD